MQRICKIRDMLVNSMERQTQLEQTIDTKTVNLNYAGKRIPHFLYFLRHAFSMLFRGKTSVKFKQNEQ
jgi:hypothetical protein